MIKKDARKRYSATESFTFEAGKRPLFHGLMPRKMRSQAAYLEHELKVGERLDSLAEDYYGDPRLWWVIAQANGVLLSPEDLVYETETNGDGIRRFRAGRTLHIPAKPEEPE